MIIRFVPFNGNLCRSKLCVVGIITTEMCKLIFYSGILVLHVKTFPVVLAKCLLRGKRVFLRKRLALFIDLQTVKSEHVVCRNLDGKAF